MSRSRRTAPRCSRRSTGARSPASARRAARAYFDHAWRQVYFFEQTLEGWTRLTDPCAILTVLNDPAQICGRDYLWTSAAPALVVEQHGALRMMTAADLAARIAELEQDGPDGAAAVGLVEGKISNETFEEWNRETGGKKLPERVKRTSARKKNTRKTARQSASRAPKRKR